MWTIITLSKEVFIVAITPVCETIRISFRVVGDRIMNTNDKK